LAVESEVDTKTPADTTPVATASPVATTSSITAASIQGPSANGPDSSSASQSDQDLAPKTIELTPEDCAASTICVQINARENAWVSISVDGKVIAHSTLVAPARKLIAAQRRLVIRAGNIGALDFRFNGAQLPAQGDYDEAKTLSFSPNGLETGAPAPHPTASTD
jgi:hypothetical protein